MDRYDLSEYNFFPGEELPIPVYAQMCVGFLPIDGYVCYLYWKERQERRSRRSQDTVITDSQWETVRYLCSIQYLVIWILPGI